MFKVNNKNTCVFYTIFFRTYFTPFSSISIVDFQQIYFSWVWLTPILEQLYEDALKNKKLRCNFIKKSYKVSCTCQQ